VPVIEVAGLRGTMLLRFFEAESRRRATLHTA
jgi:hypothetical protein